MQSRATALALPPIRLTCTSQIHSHPAPVLLLHQPQTAAAVRLPLAEGCHPQRCCHTPQGNARVLDGTCSSRATCCVSMQLLADNPLPWWHQLVCLVYTDKGMQARQSTMSLQCQVPQAAEFGTGYAGLGAAQLLPQTQQGVLLSYLSHALSNTYRLALGAAPSSESAAASWLPRAVDESLLYSSARVRYLQHEMHTALLLFAAMQVVPFCALLDVMVKLLSTNGRYGQIWSFSALLSCTCTKQVTSCYTDKPLTVHWAFNHLQNLCSKPHGGVAHLTTRMLRALRQKCLTNADGMLLPGLPKLPSNCCRCASTAATSVSACSRYNRCSCRYRLHAAAHSALIPCRMCCCRTMGLCTSATSLANHAEDSKWMPTNSNTHKTAASIDTSVFMQLLTTRTRPNEQAVCSAQHSLSGCMHVRDVTIQG